jgi:putative radical SAM enzyme (TIGR03279 family)
LLEIARVAPGSIADGLELRQGDHIISINGEAVNDVIDYRFYVADERISLSVKKRSDAVKTFRIRKPADDDLGIELPPLTIKRCRNHCIFCFVDQMPSDCRRSLYVKDDDFRASFLYGNYITLGNLSEQDLERIFKQRLSPLYISVHSTEPELRSFMLGNRKAPDILTLMKRLAAGGIRMHTQIVTCPGVNDGQHLVKTLEDVSRLFPAVMSIAAVPVGVTAYRTGLYPVKVFSRKGARAVLDTIDKFSDRFRRKFGTRLVFASDEFYIKAGVQFPSASSYEEFPQIENGVGMVAEFLREAARTRVPVSVPPLKVTVVTGASFGPILKTALERFKDVKGLTLRQVVAKNRFFGPSVTVAGLLTGGDIVHALKGKRLGDLVLIPASVLKDDEHIFLDNMSLDQMEDLLGLPVRVVTGFRNLVDILRGKE